MTLHNNKPKEVFLLADTEDVPNIIHASGFIPRYLYKEGEFPDETNWEWGCLKLGYVTFRILVCSKTPEWIQEMTSMTGERQ